VRDYLTAEKAGTHLSEDEWTEIQMAVALLRDRILSPTPTEGEQAGTDGEPEQATEIIANTVSEFYASQVMESVERVRGIGDAWIGADLHRVCDAAARSVGGK
jgi:hypothetical protein